MDWLNALGGHVVPRGGENLPAWDGKTPGRYEVWYLTLNAPADAAALWIRYVIEVPARDEPYAEVWATFFDAKAPEKSFGLKKRVGREAFTLGGDALVRVDGAVLAEGRLSGAIEDGGHRLAWDLSFSPSSTAYFLWPRALRPVMTRLRTNWTVPNADVRFHGRAVVDGRELALSAAPGQQGHLFGARHAPAWAWVHCNAFDGGTTALVEGLAGSTTVAGRPLTLTFVNVRYEGKDYLCNAVPNVLRATSDVAFPSWTFTCSAGATAFHGRVSADPARCLQVRYEDPDGAPRYCCNTELADLELQVHRSGLLIDTLRASGTAHFEVGGPSARPGVRRI